MNELLTFWEIPTAGRYMIAGWHQWADAGSISSGLPQYLIDESKARKIGEARPDSFYLFQIPGTHHFLRPIVKLDEGHRVSMEKRKNEFYYAGDAGKGFFIFLGEEPHQNEDQYVGMFLDAVEELGIKRVAILGGVHGPVPYDKDREISCVYSLPEMKDELERYAVRLSDYEGGATIGAYVAHKAEERGLEVVVLYAFAPSYDFSEGDVLTQRLAMEEDFKSWYDVMVRLRHMFGLEIDLSDLERRSQELTLSWHEKIDQLKKMPQLRVEEFLAQVNEEFTERTFEPLSHVWEDALGEIFED